jgi:hypothetical protein
MVGAQRGSATKRRRQYPWPRNDQRDCRWFDSTVFARRQDVAIADAMALERCKSLIL